MTTLRVRDLTPAFGSEVEGFDPATVMDPGIVRELGDLFDERALLLFRGSQIDHEFQVALVETLIDRLMSFEDGRERSFSSCISNQRAGGIAPFGRLQFHSDAAWCEQPTRVVSLYADEIQPPAVPTLFTSTTLAWETLPPDLKDHVDRLSCVQVTGQVERGKDAEELLQFVRENTYSTTTPVGRVHPLTGRRMLSVNPMTTAAIVELAAAESEQLLEELFAYLGTDQNLWRHEWRNHDLVVWDNLAVLHARPNVTDDGPVRTLYKTSAPTMPPEFEAPTYAYAQGDGA